MLIIRGKLAKGQLKVTSGEPEGSIEAVRCGTHESATHKRLSD